MKCEKTLIYLLENCWQSEEILVYFWNCSVGNRLKLLHAGNINGSINETKLLQTVLKRNIFGEHSVLTYKISTK